MWLSKGNRTTRADWFTRSEILRRISDSSRIISGRYYVRIGQTPEDILNGKEGWCDHQKRMIWVNPLAVYTASVFGLRTPEMNPLQEKAVVQAIMRGVLGLEPDLDLLRKVLGIQVIPADFHSNNAAHIMSAQRTIREWMRRYNGLTTREEWLFTQYVTFHERLHERFTDAKEKREQNLLGMLWNALEDERIERVGAGRWLRVAWFVRHGNKILWRVVRSRLYETLRGENPVLAIANVVVFARLGFRDGEIEGYEVVRRELRPEFHAALDECWPHVLRAWNECRNASEVKVEAAAIVEILRKHFPDQTGEMMGEGSMDCPMPDLSQRRASRKDEADDDAGEGDSGEEEGDDLNDASAGLGDQEIDPGTEKIDQRAMAPEGPKVGGQPGPDEKAFIPSDYHEILNDPQIAEGVNRLRRAFAIPDPREQNTKARDRRRGRLSAKAYRKTDGEQPFITRIHQRDPGRLYVELIGDWSGSMESAVGSRESPVWFMRKAAVMVLAALMGHKRVLFNCRLMPNNVHVATNHEGEDGLMRCAGILANAGTQYWPTFEAAYLACKKQGCPSLVMLIADGQFSSGTDKEKTKFIRERCERDDIEVRVLYVTSRENVSNLRYAFGDENVILLKDAKELPMHIEAMVASVGTKQYRRVYV